MSVRTFDAIVLGVGGMGSAAAFELARHGSKFSGWSNFLSFTISVVRTAIRESFARPTTHPNYVPLAKRSFERWYDLEQLCGRHLLTECGCLNIGPPDSELVSGVRRAAEEHGFR